MVADAMKFRLTAFAWHLSASLGALSLVLGGLYLGWYRWPGWYLTGALGVVPILVMVDAALGPLITLLIANPRKPRRELLRDIAIIVTVQLAALAYGSFTLWNGRPLYYTFSVDRLEMVQASDLDPHEIALARQRNPHFAPHWYSLPRWVWAPLPENASERQAIVSAAISGSDDVIQMPRYFKPWNLGLPALRQQLKTVEAQNDMRLYKRKPRLKQQLQESGIAPDQPVTLIMTGRGAPLLAVFDAGTLQIKALLRVEP
jgi:hypothetical protein